ncbi:protein kinase family protein [Streptacidiphilus griseoplanus]|uniref:protein kinase family protein n=1 Tax=Peterkaempfera griseoplana TaxID=66896 RepID=UPI0007C6D71B
MSESASDSDEPAAEASDPEALATVPSAGVTSTADTPGPEASASATTTAVTAAPAATADAPVAPLLPAPVRHSGDKVAGRYRLEECISQAGVFTSWRAVDEKLRRAVGIHLLAAGHERSRAVLAAARSAALLGDPRFVQVLDAVTDGDLVYIIREWLPDATDLATLLTAGPMEPYDAYQMVRQVTDAVAAAHRRGQSHLRLTPKCVLRTDSGQFRITGIAVDAALHGLNDDNAERDDTKAIGALLYAALCHRWPYPEDKYDLQGMPRQIGCVPPDQVRAGVHRGLSEIAVQALCDEPPRHLDPLTTPEDLAKAIALMPKVRQPEPEPVTAVYPPPVYPKPAGPVRSAFQSPAPVPVPSPMASVVPPQAPPVRRSRGGRAVRWSAAVLLLAALGLGSWGLADHLRRQDDGGSDVGRNSAEVNNGSGPRQQTPARPLAIKGGAEFSPLSEPIEAQKVPLAYDGSASTAWVTAQYKGQPNFGNRPQRAQGSGIVVDLGSVKSISEVKATMYVAGQQVDVRAASEGASDPQRLADFPTVLRDSATTGSQLNVELKSPVRTRYVLIHITELPAEQPGGGTYRGGISEIQVLG